MLLAPSLPRPLQLVREVEDRLQLGAAPVEIFVKLRPFRLSLAAGIGRSYGKRSVKTAPPSGAFAASTPPPCASTT